MLSKYKSAALFVAAAGLLLCALAVNFGCGKTGGSLDVYSVAEAPVFSPSSGTYTSAQTVSISSPTSAATIYYTTDDSEPKETSTKYTGAINVSATVRIKAKAYLAPKVPSAITSADYYITGTVATPTFSPEAGTYSSAQDVSISCLTSGAAITYTLDGSTPTEASTPYTGPITIAATTTLKARAFRADWGASGIASGTYFIGQENIPSITAGGTFEGVTSKSVVITGSSGSTIYYTTDGSEPSDTSYAGSGSSPLTVDIELDTNAPVKIQTIKAISAVTGKVNSPITSETYTLSVTTETKTFTSSYTGKHTSIAIGSNNHPYISCYDGNRVDLFNYNGAWDHSSITSVYGFGLGGGYNSIAVFPGSTDVYHTSFYDESSGALKYYKRSSPGVEEVDSGGVGAYTSIALDPAGTPYISYYDSTNRKVKYASIESVSSSYFPEFISDSALNNDNYGRSAIAVDDSANIYVLYHENGKVMSKTRAPLGNFTKEVIDSYSPAGYYLDLAVGRGSGSGVNVYAIFCTPSLQYSRSYNSGTSWTSPSSISSSNRLEYISLAVDSRGASDILHISAYDASSETLKYFTNVSGQWKEYCVDDGLKVGSYSSIAVDGNGCFHISYYDEANGRLKYATNK